MRHVFRLGTSLAAAGLALGATFTARPAHACGGCFTESMSESVITDEKMVLSISPSQTTLYDQINYSGSPASFAWVLPIHGTVEVGLSADVMFEVLDSLTATTVEAPPLACAPPPPGCGTTYNTSAGTTSGTATTGGVTVTSQQQVGPYEAVQLQSNDGSALTAWLTSHGYQIPASTRPIIGAYVTQGFDFLALKLVPGAGVQSMQPVRVTSSGAAPSLPLHMVAIGTGPTTGITIWLVASGRWAPTNFPTFTISPASIVWDWTTQSSNYESLRLAAEATYGGAGWQIESSLELSQYTISQALLDNVEYGTVGGYTPLPDGDGGVDASSGGGGSSTATTPASSAGSASTEAATTFSGGETTGGTPSAPPGQVAAATADLGVLFSGIAAPNVRITRMRSDVAQSALSVDMQLGAATDQSEMSNIYVAGQQTGTPPCPSYGTCSNDGSSYSSSSSCAAGSSDAAGSSTLSTVAVTLTTPSPGQIITTSSEGASPSGSGAASAPPESTSGCSTTSPADGAGPSFVLFAFAVSVARRVRTKGRRRRDA
jgi:hypothetical protein